MVVDIPKWHVNQIIMKRDNVIEFDTNKKLTEKRFYTFYIIF